MKCNCKITILILLATLNVCALYTTQNLQDSPSTSQKLISLIRFKINKNPHFNLSPSPPPSPSPSPIPSHAPPRHHVCRHNRHHFPPPVPLPDPSDDENRMLLVAVLVAACLATCIICLIFLFLCFKNLRTLRRTKSTSDNTKTEAFSSDPPLVTSLKHCSKDRDRLTHLEEDDTKHGMLTVRNILSNSENLDSSASDAVLVESLKYHEDDDRSFQSFNKTLVPPPPQPPRYQSSSSSTTFLLESSTTSDSCSGSNRTLAVKTSQPPPQRPPSQPMPTGEDGIRLPKLKPLHWDKVRAGPDRSMVWDKLKSSSFEIDETQNRFDEELIESLFSYNQHNNNEELKNKSPSPGKHILEPKRLQNLTILFKALNATTEQVCCALVRGSGLNLQQLEVLIKMEPTKEEEAKITGYKGDLGSAETFIATVLRIPYAFQRIQALLYRETFEDEVIHLRTSFPVLEHWITSP